MNNGQKDEQKQAKRNNNKFCYVHQPKRLPKSKKKKPNKNHKTRNQIMITSNQRSTKQWQQGKE